jgi:hypothetical protein
VVVSGDAVVVLGGAVVVLGDAVIVSADAVVVSGDAMIGAGIIWTRFRALNQRGGDLSCAAVLLSDVARSGAAGVFGASVGAGGAGGSRVCRRFSTGVMVWIALVRGEFSTGAMARVKPGGRAADVWGMTSAAKGSGRVAATIDVAGCRRGGGGGKLWAWRGEDGCWCCFW